MMPEYADSVFFFLGISLFFVCFPITVGIQCYFMLVQVAASWLDTCITRRVTPGVSLGPARHHSRLGAADVCPVPRSTSPDCSAAADLSSPSLPLCRPAPQRPPHVVTIGLSPVSVSFPSCLFVYFVL